MLCAFKKFKLVGRGLDDKQNKAYRNGLIMFRRYYPGCKA